MRTPVAKREHLITLSPSDVLKDEPFAFTRWGDGEIGVMSRQEPYFGIVTKRESWDYADWGQEALWGAFHLICMVGHWVEKPKIYFGVQPMSLDFNLTAMKEINEAYVANKIDIYNAETFHTMSINSGPDELVTYLAKKRDEGKDVVMIAPDFAKNILKRFNVSHHIPVKVAGAHKQIDEVYDAMSPYFGKGTVFLYSAGFLSNVLIADALLLNRNTLDAHIDLGSFIDPYCGITSRRYHQAIIDREKMAQKQEG